jgi:type III pantothenate kinase
VILELDLGNTRGKWRIVRGDEVVARGAADIADWLAGRVPEVWSGADRVRVASVRDAALDLALLAALRPLGAPVQQARSQAYCAGVTNAYADVARLGVDRWLAMLSAYNEFRVPVLVAQAGSALTLDLVDGVGLHRGGYIIPGARLMAQALLGSTDRVRFEPTTALESLAPGAVTDACVHNGIALAMVGAVRLALQQARTSMGAVRLVVAGGDAEALLRLMPGEPCEARPDLVLDGLRWALP